MTNETVSALKAAVGRWVCRKGASAHPGLLTDADIHDLVVATQAGISAPVSPEGEREWGNLRELTKDWVVQQKLGIEPGPLQVSDFEHLASLIPQALPASEPMIAPTTPQEHPDNVSPAVADVELWAREAVDLTFAREHLERCL